LAEGVGDATGFSHQLLIHVWWLEPNQQGAWG